MVAGGGERGQIHRRHHVRLIRGQRQGGERGPVDANVEAAHSAVATLARGQEQGAQGPDGGLSGAEVPHRVARPGQIGERLVRRVLVAAGQKKRVGCKGGSGDSGVVAAAVEASLRPARIPGHLVPVDLLEGEQHVDHLAGRRIAWRRGLEGIGDDAQRIRV